MAEVYGYVRVSTREQKEDRQMIAMSEAGITKKNIYMDKQSGKDFNRPMYQKLLKKLKENDVLFIKSIDRLGRNYEEVLEQWRILTKEKKVDVVTPLVQEIREEFKEYVTKEVREEPKAITPIKAIEINEPQETIAKKEGNEIEKEEDRNFVIAVFSGVVSFAALIIGDKYANSRYISLGFECQRRMEELGFVTKAVIVKNIVGNEKAKGKTANLWRYRALSGGFNIFEHEYIMIFQKTKIKNVKKLKKEGKINKD